MGAASTVVKDSPRHERQERKHPRHSSTGPPRGSRGGTRRFPGNHDEDVFYCTRRYCAGRYFTRCSLLESAEMTAGLAGFEL